MKKKNTNNYKYAVNIGTNSLHHQAVITVPDNAVVIAWTDEKLPKTITVFPYDPEINIMQMKDLLIHILLL